MQQWPQDWKRSIFTPIQKKSNSKECSNYHTNHTHLICWQSSAQNSPSQVSPVHEPRTSRCSAGFIKCRGTRDQIANILWMIERGREFQKYIYLCFIDYAKVSDGVDHNKLWEILQEMGIPDHLT